MPSNAEPFVYLNGQWLPRSEATLDIEDRGVTFADGVYEVVVYFNGKPVELQGHLDRFARSLDGLKIKHPACFKDLPAISHDLLQRNHWPNARVYWKVTRGTARRNPAFPEAAEPTVIVMGWPIDALNPHGPIPRTTCAFVEDRRWLRCHLKTLMLLDNVLAKREANEAGFDNAIYHREGTVTESTSANLFMVKDGQVFTHPANHLILHGITRAQVMKLAHRMNITVHEQTFSTDDLLAADEVFLCGTTTYITAVTQMGDKAFDIGPVTGKLFEALMHDVAGQCAIA